MISQPEKYPNPTPNAFECQNCGREFVSIPMYTSSVLTHGVPNSPQYAQRNTTRIKWGIVIIMLLAAVSYSWLKQPQPKNSSSQSPTATAKSSTNPPSHTVTPSKTTSAPIPPVAETSAQHPVEKSNRPSEHHQAQETIAHSHNPDDTLSIKIESKASDTTPQQHAEHPTTMP
ncbi:hypothetical protein [Acinetobacter larvae]|uniref:Uncharacterized protein n=1 Tax=Acinetobacter larvae TaxID=1789224 RepID=A0A1B2M0V4_9GAMM|nr:hypothetical protein [Acinetobacter larvae]AOA58791.1 hypothetical protein BFG52_10815 [Acinetobacter larvae]